MYNIFSFFCYAVTQVRLSCATKNLLTYILRPYLFILKPALALHFQQNSSCLLHLAEALVLSASRRRL